MKTLLIAAIAAGVILPAIPLESKSNETGGQGRFNSAIVLDTSQVEWGEEKTPFSTRYAGGMRIDTYIHADYTVSQTITGE